VQGETEGIGRCQAVLSGENRCREAEAIENLRAKDGDGQQARKRERASAAQALDLVLFVLEALARQVFGHPYSVQSSS